VPIISSLMAKMVLAKTKRKDKSEINCSRNFSAKRVSSDMFLSRLVG